MSTASIRKALGKTHIGEKASIRCAQFDGKSEAEIITRILAKRAACNAYYAANPNDAPVYVIAVPRAW